MSTSGHNQRQVSTTVERVICEDFIVDTCVPLRGKKISLVWLAGILMITYFRRIVLLIKY